MINFIRIVLTLGAFVAFIERTEAYFFNKKRSSSFWSILFVGIWFLLELFSLFG
jgi:hypothetical protein